MEKRKWCYVLPPYAYDIECDKCHRTNIDWSEFEHCIWCYDCKIDTEGTEGVFGGPIPIMASYILGRHFDRINLETQQIERLNLDTLNEEHKLVWDPPDVVQKNISSKERTKKMLKDKKITDPYGEDVMRIGSQYFKLVPAKKHNSK